VIQLQFPRRKRSHVGKNLLSVVTVVVFARFATTSIIIEQTVFPSAEQNSVESCGCEEKQLQKMQNVSPQNKCAQLRLGHRVSLRQ
jgi:hypothetical protein